MDVVSQSTGESRPDRPWHRVLWPTLAAFSMLLSLGAIVLVLWFLQTSHPRLPEVTAANANQDSYVFNSNQLNACIGNTFNAIKGASPDIDLFERVWALCGQQIHALDALHDFDQRVDKFTRQDFDERVILIMVVTITCSGVILAGLQLFASYNLSIRSKHDFTQDTALSLERDKISLKSSVTGLVILVVSLAFFVVYILWVYTITETKGERPSFREQVSVNQPRAKRLLHLKGGLDAPFLDRENKSARGSNASSPNRQQ